MDNHPSPFFSITLENPGFEKIMLMTLIVNMIAKSQTPGKHNH